MIQSWPILILSGALTLPIWAPRLRWAKLRAPQVRVPQVGLGADVFWGLLRGIILPKRDKKYVGFKIIKCKLAMLFFSKGESEYRYKL